MRCLARCALASLALALPTGLAAAQQVNVDRAVRADELWCFPIEGQPGAYRYVPAGARLALDEAGGPQFSFLRYVHEREPDGDSSQTIQAAEGGAIVHFLVLYETPAETVERAQVALRRLLDDDSVSLQGPILFSSGRYTVISSILGAQHEGRQRSVLATGRAPVLEGNRLALTFELGARESTLLMKSFEMAVPDVSLVFDMSFAGLADAYDAELLVDWSAVSKSQAFEASANYLFVKAEVARDVEELMQEQAITLRSSGSDEGMQALLAHVYDRLLELLFRPVEPERMPPEVRVPLLERLVDAGLEQVKDKLDFGARVGYRMKTIRSEGHSVLRFNKRATVTRNASIAFNIGDLQRRFGDDESYFRTVNLADAAFRQRVVHVGVDGGLLPEFDGIVNGATVTIRKQHGSGATTLREVIVDRDSASQGLQDLAVTYGWDQDEDPQGWMDYEYRVYWSFQGGASFESDWIRTDVPMIQLFTPYEQLEIEVLADAQLLAEEGVRAAVVQVEVPFFGELRRRRVTVRPERGFDGETLLLTVPLGRYDYDYRATWFLDDGSRRSTERHDDSGVIFLDELPPAKQTPLSRSERR